MLENLLRKMEKGTIDLTNHNPASQILEESKITFDGRMNEVWTGTFGKSDRRSELEGWRGYYRIFSFEYWKPGYQKIFEGYLNTLFKENLEEIDEQIKKDLIMGLAVAFTDRASSRAFAYSIYAPIPISLSDTDEHILKNELTHIAFSLGAGSRKNKPSLAYDQYYKRLVTLYNKFKDAESFKLI